MVSNDGRLWGAYRQRELVTTIERGGGYVRFNLFVNGRNKTVRVHRLVAAAFLGPAPADKPFVCHRDGDPTNNLVDNLYYGTVSDNLMDTLRHGTHPQASKTHCKNGHQYAGENLDTYKGLRRCRTCMTARSRARDARISLQRRLLREAQA